MRVLLDETVDWRLASAFDPEHTVVTPPPPCDSTRDD